MRILVQRVLEASCTVDGKLISKIGPGLCLFVGIEKTDDEEVLKRMVQKVLKLRIFEDENHRMNESILQTHGEILSISQFTLYADLKGQHRPGFTKAAPYDFSKELYERFNELLDKRVDTQGGVFGADMKIALINDGPVTIWMDSNEIL